MFRVGESTSMGSRVSKGILQVATEHGNKDEDDEHFATHDLLENENNFEYISQKEENCYQISLFLNDRLFTIIHLYLVE